jgi:hypothetical protein
MPITWTISHPSQLVVAVARDVVGLADMEDYLDNVMVAGAMSYRKIFDTTNGTLTLENTEMMALGARIRAYSATTPMGPLAIVAGTPKSYADARMYMTLASAERQMQLFQELTLARKWLDGQVPPRPPAN